MECFGYGNPLAFIPQIFIPFFHPFQMCLHEFFMISFLSVFFYWNFVFTTIGIENHMQWQKANFSIKIHIAQCIDAFNSYDRKRKSFDKSQHFEFSRLNFMFVWFMNVANEQSNDKIYTKQVIERMQQRNVEILTFYLYPIFLFEIFLYSM